MAALKFDGKAFSLWMDENSLSRQAVASRLLRTSNAIHNWIHNGTIDHSSYAALLQCYNLPYGTFLFTEKEASHAVKAQEAGYDVTLRVFPDKLRMGLTFNGKEIKYAYAKVMGDTELDLAKSISYAAHLIYKFIEQDTME